ncbi:MAG: hypothetical protein MZV64_24975 [Ignavibacteriales bacterium]|nr:hypothetical protein [Ignavibacteriales bacterium]
MVSHQATIIFVSQAKELLLEDTGVLPIKFVPKKPGSYLLPEKLRLQLSSGPFNLRRDCNGISIPLIQFDIKPTDRVGVIGIGGLGHMALRFLSAWGCYEVTSFLNKF